VAPEEGERGGLTTGDTGNAGKGRVESVGGVKVLQVTPEQMRAAVARAEANIASWVVWKDPKAKQDVKAVEEGRDTDGQGQARTGVDGQSVAGGTCKVAREEGEELEAERGRSWELAERVVWWQEWEEKVRRELGEQLAAEREISERLSADLVRKEEERRELWERAHAAEREAAGFPGLREELAEARQEHKDAVELAEKCLRQTEYWRKSREASEEQRRVLERRLEVMEQIVQSKLEVIEGLRARLGYVEGGGFRGLMARVFGRKAGKGEGVER
jgi:hypothetical protein